jgi:hypothetical protein
VTLNASVFDIQKYLGVEINGCSLPLKVYKENISETDSNLNGVFNSLITPSLVGPYSHDDEKKQNVFSFYCFGTDEQSIKITYIGENIQDSRYITIVFDANGGSGVMPEQKVLMDVPITLNKSLFSRKGLAFAGWSTQKTDIGGVAEFGDSGIATFLTDVYTNTDRIVLYAVWDTESSGTVNGTEITFRSDGKSTVYVDSAEEIFPGQTVIDYGD